MPTVALETDVSAGDAAGGEAAAWSWFRYDGSAEQLRAAVGRLESAGWTISDDPPRSGPEGTWHVQVLPPHPQCPVVPALRVG